MQIITEKWPVYQNTIQVKQSGLQVIGVGNGMPEKMG